MPLHAEFRAMGVWCVGLAAAAAARFAIPAVAAAASPAVFWVPVVAGLALVARRFAAGNALSPAVDRARLDGKVAIVTGAAGGLGFQTALALAVRGATVVLACRSVARNKEAADLLRAHPLARTAGAELRLIEKHTLELESFASVRAFAAGFRSEGLPLHILVNNAGGADFANRKVSNTHRQLEWSLCVNFLSHVLLAEELMPVLKESGGRVVCVSSVAHKTSGKTPDLVLAAFKSCNDVPDGTPTWDRYNLAKLGNIYQAHYLCSKGVLAAALHPGVVATEFASSFAAWAVPILKALGIYLFVKTEEEGARTSINAAIGDAQELQLSGISEVAAAPGQSVTREAPYFADCTLANSELQPQARDLKAASLVMDWAFLVIAQASK
jgi:NAD(P)-dependent dehydrogenase (short-subunit alcohol dehydrogenase family)